MALFTSLGWVPFGCAGRSSDTAAGIGSDSGGARSDPDDPPSPASCGADTPVLAAARPSFAVDYVPVLHPAIETGIYLCENGVQHRPASVTCSSGLPRSSPADADAGSGPSQGAAMTQVHSLYGEGFAEGTCSSDADCTDQPHGYCAPVYLGGPGPAHAQCRYGCLTDGDCSTGQLCECGDPVGQCVQATCQTDEDCPGDLLCAAWFSANVCGVSHAFTCQTALDECRTAADCGQEFGTYCSGEGQVRQCKINGAVCGRPYLVQGDARRATCIGVDDWCGAELVRNSESTLADLTPEQRRHVGEQWSEMGLLEHASIAAFARFTLQLLHVGAPYELVEQSQRAMLDETVHTRLCFGLASRYLGRHVGPGRLPMDAALDETDFAQIVVTTFREGCVGETVATLEARAAAERATDPEVKSALERIAEDELRHSELAWRFVSWALGVGGAALQGAIAAEVRRVERDVAPPVDPRQTAPGVSAHGILSDHDKQQARRAALSEVVLPCALALAASIELPARMEQLDAAS